MILEDKTQWGKNWNKRGSQLREKYNLFYHRLVKISQRGCTVHHIHHCWFPGPKWIKPWATGTQNWMPEAGGWTTWSPEAPSSPNYHRSYWGKMPQFIVYFPYISKAKHFKLKRYLAKTWILVGFLSECWKYIIYYISAPFPAIYNNKAHINHLLDL